MDAAKLGGRILKGGKVNGGFGAARNSHLAEAQREKDQGRTRQGAGVFFHFHHKGLGCSGRQTSQAAGGFAGRRFILGRTGWSGAGLFAVRNAPVILPE